MLVNATTVRSAKTNQEKTALRAGAALQLAAPIRFAMKALINATTMMCVLPPTELHKIMLRVDAKIKSVKMVNTATIINATTVRSAPREMRATQARAFAERPPARRIRHTARRITVLVRIPLLSSILGILTAPQRRACAKASGATESAPQTQGVLSAQRTRSGTTSRSAKTGKTYKSACATKVRCATLASTVTSLLARALQGPSALPDTETPKLQNNVGAERKIHIAPQTHNTATLEMRDAMMARRVNRPTVNIKIEIRASAEYIKHSANQPNRTAMGLPASAAPFQNLYLTAHVFHTEARC